MLSYVKSLYAPAEECECTHCSARRMRRSCDTYFKYLGPIHHAYVLFVQISHQANCRNVIVHALLLGTSNTFTLSIFMPRSRPSAGHTTKYHTSQLYSWMCLKCISADMKSFIAKWVISIFVNLRYLQLKLLKYKENKKICETFDHNFKNKPLQLDLGYPATSYPAISIIRPRSCSVHCLIFHSVPHKILL